MSDPDDQYIAVVINLARKVRAARARVDAFRRAAGGLDKAISAFLTEPTKENLKQIERTRAVINCVREMKGFDDEL